MRAIPRATIAAVGECVAARDSAHWESALGATDTCCTVVRTMEEAVRDLHFKARGVFDREVKIPGHVLPALPVPVARGASNAGGECARASRG